MDFSLREDQELFVKGVRDFARGEIAPLCAQMDREGIIDSGLLDQIRQQGFFGLTFPEEYGGVGLDTHTYGLVIRELARVDAGVAIMVAVHNSVGFFPILKFGSDDLKSKYLPRMAQGELASFCVTEPGAGSDAAAMSTRAEKVDGGYRLTGEKIWVTNGYFAEFFVVMARTGGAGPKGISAFLVERGTEGLQIGAKEEKMGLRSSDAISLVLDGAFVPEENRIGDEGIGLKVALSALDGGRIGVAYQALGIADACLDAAARYSIEREQFGQPIARQQAIQWMLAEGRTELTMASLLADKASWLKDQGKPYGAEAAMAKLGCTEMAWRLADRAVQIHGGYGYSKDYDVERYYRDVRVLRIYEGTSEIQKIVIARDLLAEYGA
jgi:alkylation response protein AidB-like acyl-CoA dehydrogenase